MEGADDNFLFKLMFAYEISLNDLLLSSFSFIAGRSVCSLQAVGFSYGIEW